MTTRHLIDPAQDPVPVGTPEFKAHAHERYAQLRSLAPIHRVRLADSSVSWLVVGYDLAREALAHPKLSKNPEPYAEALRAAGREILLAGTGFGGNMLMADPPEHTRLRRLVAGAFTSGAAERLAPRIEELAHELIDAIADRGEADLVASYTGPLPMAVICELLGVPAQRQADLQAWTRTAVGNPSAPQRSSLLALNAYLRDLLEVKRQSPANDLLSRLIAVRDQDGGRLSEAELLGTTVILVVAGHETTVNLLGNAVVALLRHPDQACALRARPELIPGAVEEFLRFDASVETTPARFATESFTLGGQTIKAGDTVVVALGSAGRDAPVEPGGDPDRLDVGRASSRHLSFGHGIHHCIGAPLARLEAAIALQALLTRLPDLRWADPAHEVEWLPAGITRGPVRLPVRFTPAER
ncbi:cytochrome P450 family protein [Streptomyces melanosporofaciens]|uniref:Cytochrome P450 n=1 Tax=Streptomyces melanosporofaciens TaxID=67327 RepID=A0A1H4I8D9_STRMJ|nr:cytochrome P450 [Streptomyces melanosporofaciens]SEB30317.1 Cytochrome P450 [Streptomyces melanosporofaciens]